MLLHPMEFTQYVSKKLPELRFDTSCQMLCLVDDKERVVSYLTEREIMAKIGIEAMLEEMKQAELMSERQAIQEAADTLDETRPNIDTPEEV